MYEKVVTLEAERGDDVNWTFKALQHIVNLNFKLGDFAAMTSRYTELLKHINKVTSNECTEAINSVLDNVSGSTDVDVLGEMYAITLSALKSANNERLWFSINVRKAKLLLRAKEFTQLKSIIRELHQSCMLEDGKTDDASKSTNLMEMYALDIQLCTAQGNRARMKEIHPKVQALSSAISDPRIMGVVHESFGRMHMLEGKYEEGYTQFYEAFKGYQEAGRQSNARNALKYLVLANMLALSDINPFDSREAKVYKDDPEIMAMDNLRTAYQRDDINLFERILSDKTNNIMNDEFIQGLLKDLLRRVRSQALVKMVQPYKSIRLAFLAESLGVDVPEVENLLVELILDDRLFGRIDQINGCLQLGSTASATSKTYHAVDRWTNAMNGLRSALEKSVQ